LLGAWVNFTVPEAVQNVRELVTLWEENKDCLENRGPKDDSPADPFIILATHELIFLYWKTKLRTYLIDALLLLRRAHVFSRENYQFRLLLIRLNNHPAIGANISAGEFFQDLIKGVQYESLGYLTYYDLIRVGNNPFFEKLLNKLTKFHENEMKSSIFEYSKLAYDKHNYSEIGEFVDFYVRLKYSEFYLQMKQESSFHKFIKQFGEFRPNVSPPPSLTMNPIWSTTPLEITSRFSNDDTDVLNNYSPSKYYDRLESFLHFPSPPCSSGSYCVENETPQFRKSYFILLSSLVQAFRFITISDAGQFSEYASKIENILDNLHLGMESELVFDDPEQQFLAQIYHILTNFFKPTLHILHSKTLALQDELNVSELLEALENHRTELEKHIDDSDLTFSTIIENFQVEDIFFAHGTYALQATQLLFSVILPFIKHSLNYFRVFIDEVESKAKAYDVEERNSKISISCETILGLYQAYASKFGHMLNILKNVICELQAASNDKIRELIPEFTSILPIILEKNNGDFDREGFGNRGNSGRFGGYMEALENTV